MRAVLKSIIDGVTSLIAVVPDLTSRLVGVIETVAIDISRFLEVVRARLEQVADYLDQLGK